MEEEFPDQYKEEKVEEYSDDEEEYDDDDEWAKFDGF
jgi:hypothetical protein